MRRLLLTRARRVTASGFTLVELLVLLVLAGTLLTLGLPAILGMIHRSQMISTAQEVAVLLRSARIEAVRTGIPAVVRFQAGERSLVAFSNAVRDGNGRFSNLDQDANERELGKIVLPQSVHAGAPAADNLINSFSGTAPTPLFAADIDIPGAVFLSDGSALAEGAFRFSDASGRNFLEVRVAPRFTGRVAIRKFNPSPPTATPPTFWFESGFSSGAATGSGRNTWEWY